MRIALLKAELVAHGLNQMTVAGKLGMAYSTFNAKINGLVEFNLSELRTLKSLLEMSDEKFDQIFFTDEVSSEGES